MEVNTATYDCSMNKEDDELINETFIGKDGQLHKYVFGEDYLCHTYMTNEEFYEKNNKNALKSCSKCPMWQKCRTSEYTVATSSSVSRKLVDELSHTIDMHIIERIKNKSI